MLRIGQGYDLHRTISGRPLILGGVPIPAPFGLDGHSDADVLLHAITDAVIGSIAAGDIGGWFSDQDPQYAGADSALLLKQVLDDPRFAGWKLCNLDCTVIAQQPKLADYKADIQRRIAEIFGVAPNCISVKAKTNEHIDALGRGEAIAAMATLLAETAP